MSSTVTNNLSKAKIQQLLAAVGSRTTEDTSQTEAAEYDWHQPHYFSSNQLKKLDNFTRKVASVIAQKFAAFYHNDFNVTIASTTQHFANELLNELLESGQNDYYLAFGADQQRDAVEFAHPCGLIGIPTQTAIVWATQLLGDTKSEEDSSRDLSQLEKSLLLDTASTIVEALSASSRSLNFQPAKSIVKGHPPFEPQSTEELCKITFGVKKAGSDNSSEAYLLIPCSKLESAIEKATKANDKFSNEDISKAILNHLQQMSISVTAQLASTLLSFEEIMNLQVGDILLLDKRTDEPVELIVEGRQFFQGRPAKSVGKFAVLITKISCDTA